MAAVKLNVLHLHLTDDQGFNIESRLFPKLHELGKNGSYYTQEQIRSIVDHAASRGIRVVPEFDVPGHTAAWFAAFPDLAGYPGEYAPDRWYGGNPRNKEPHYCPAMNPTLEESYAFLDALFGEMSALFPDPYFHIGGDEVTPHHWLNNPSIVQFMQANGFEDPHALQAYFNRRLVEIVRKHGKTMIGWDEVLHPDIPTEIAIQSWRGAESLAAAAKAGHPAILSNGYYLDLMYSSVDHYAQDPHAGAAADLPDDVKANILGGEACMWSEYVTPEILDDRLWPRLAGIAERFWSPASALTDVDFLYARFPSILRHLTWTGLRSESTRSMMFDRLTGGRSTEALRTFAECLEPAKGYARRGYMTTSPLNRLVDTAPPESLAAREFTRLCEAPAENATEIFARIRRWKATLPEVAALMSTSALIAPYAAIVDQLSTVLDIAQHAIDGGPASPDQLAQLDEAGKPISEMIIAIVPAVKKLVGSQQWG
jgi:hexosaminidase